MRPARPQVCVVGSGAFGTALAAVIAEAGKADVTLLCRRPEIAATAAHHRTNETALPGIRLPETLRYADNQHVCARADIILLAVPSQAQRAAAADFRQHLRPGTVIVTCAKGLEGPDGRLMTVGLSDTLPDHDIAVLSGPGFAIDIARGLPTAMAVACSTQEIADRLAETLSGPTFRLYPSTDVIGVQLGGALKNVLAIACGIIDGASLGVSARAALIARGLAEMSRLVVALGGRAETVRGLSGLGDLVLTATSPQSRNFRYGLALGRGDAQAGTDLVEGIFAAAVAAKLARTTAIDMPVTEAVAAIIEGRRDVPSALAILMSRPITSE